MNLFASAKETANKLRWDYEHWDYEHGDTRFSLYIPKWRVPQPWPPTIYVNITKQRVVNDYPSNMSPTDVMSDQTITREPIVSTVKNYAEHTKTIRYTPVGTSDEWEIGEPYIPKSLTYDESQYLRVIILWGADDVDEPP